MSIIKGTNQIVAGFGGTKRCIGEVYFSQSALATDNPGALPGWTGEYYENGNTLFPDLYNFVKAHSELQVTKAQYDNAIATYGECPKYVVDENGASTTVLVPGYVWNVTNTGATNFRVVTKTRNPVAGDPIWASTEEQLSATGVSGLFDFSLDGDGIVYSCANDTLIVQQASNLFGEWDPAVSGNDATLVFSKEQASLGEIQVIVGTSLRLPKYTNYIKMANSTEGITQKGAGLPNIDSDTNWVNATSGTETTATNTNVLSNKGAFGGTNSTGGHGIAGNNYPINWRRFDASKSNAIYGSSDTVQPAHTTLYPWISAYTSAIPASVAQAAEFTGALSGKADNNLGNITNSGKEAVVSWGRNFVNTNQIVASGTAGIAGTYNLGFTDGKVRIGVFTCAIGTNRDGFSKMTIKTDIVTGDCMVAGTNNGFGAQSTATIPFVNSVSISFPETGAGISIAYVRFVGYFE